MSRPKLALLLHPWAPGGRFLGSEAMANAATSSRQWQSSTDHYRLGPVHTIAIASPTRALTRGFPPRTGQGRSRDGRRPSQDTKRSGIQQQALDRPGLTPAGSSHHRDSQPAALAGLSATFSRAHRTSHEASPTDYPRIQQKSPKAPSPHLRKSRSPVALSPPRFGRPGR
jgi:hypothetical protein